MSIGNRAEVDRVVIVDEHGRVYERHDIVVQLDFQDGGRTLKLYVESKELALDKAKAAAYSKEPD